MGIAISEGDITSVNQSAADFLSEWRSSPSHRQITIHDLLSMSSGLQGGRANFVRGVLSRNERRFATSLPVEHSPGAHWEYHNSGYKLLHSILVESTGESLQQYTREKLFDRIGMRRTEWATKRFNRQQTTFLRTTPRDAARYGLLVLAKGRWDGEQVIKADWLARATGAANPKLNPSYGYLWWVNGGEWFWFPLVDQRQSRSIFPGCPEDAFAALGKDDQKIYIVPSLELVVTRFGDSANATSPALSQFDDDFLGAVCRSFRKTRSGEKATTRRARIEPVDP
ncbi:MAG: serine hydrolase [Planctomycetota bacterium]